MSEKPENPIAFPGNRWTPDNQDVSEGMSLRATSRLADVSINTVTKLLIDVGQAASEYQDAKTLTLAVDPRDQPRAVGSRGKHIQALRTIFQFIGGRDQRRIQLILAEPDERAEVRESAFVPDPKWNPEPIRGIISKVLERVLREPFRIEIYSESDRALEKAGLPAGASADHTSKIDVHPSPADQQIADVIGDYMKPIVHAVGKNQGRELYLVVIRAPDGATLQ